MNHFDFLTDAEKFNALDARTKGLEERVRALESEPPMTRTTEVYVNRDPHRCADHHPHQTAHAEILSLRESYERLRGDQERGAVLLSKCQTERARLRKFAEHVDSLKQYHEACAEARLTDCIYVRAAALLREIPE